MAGIYAHIPFCHSKCWYCDFYSMPVSRYCKDYINCLLTEWEHRKHEITEPYATLYIGGGTPSALPPQDLCSLIKRLRLDSIKEVTVEVNPEDITVQYAEILLDAGVNRISMGVQSLVDTELAQTGRKHTSAQAAKAVDALRSGGINNLSLDIIFGLPGQTLESCKYTVNRILEFAPQHISAYSLSYEPGTRLWSRLQTGKEKEAPQELSAEMYSFLCQALSERGYDHYEISNFALPGFCSRHNSSYWDMTPYLGLGAAAHSFDGQLRRVNPPDIKKYIAHGGLTTSVQYESKREQLNDYIMLRLRTSAGLDMDIITNKFGRSATDEILNTATPYLAAGSMQYTSEKRLRITEQAWIVSDGIMCEFMQID